jgi:hypothetical protein
MRFMHVTKLIVFVVEGTLQITLRGMRGRGSWSALSWRHCVKCYLHNDSNDFGLL